MLWLTKMMNEKIYLDKVERHALERTLRVFDGDTSNEVARPTVEWLSYVTELGDAYAVLACLAGEDIGLIQLDLDGDVAYISVFIKERCRGRGFFRPLLEMAMKTLPSRIRIVKAFISMGNHISLGAFKSAGYEEEPEIDEDGMHVLTLTIGGAYGSS